MATVLVLAAVTITERRPPQRRVIHLKARYARSAAIEPRAFDALLAEHGLRSITTEQSLTDGVIEYGAIADGYDEERGERLVATLSSDTYVQGFEIRPQQA